MFGSGDSVSQLRGRLRVGGLGEADAGADAEADVEPDLLASSADEVKQLLRLA